MARRASQDAVPSMGLQKREPIGLTNVLDKDCYRSNITPRAKDMLFPLLEPIICFGGVSSYFLIAIAALRKRLGIAAAGAVVQTFALYIGHASEDSDVLKGARKAWLAMARRSLPTLVYLGAPPQRIGTRPQCLLLLPHGLFCIAGKRYASEVTSSGRQPGMTMFVDIKLSAFSPYALASARLCGATKLRSLGDKNVRAAMELKENICVFPGGFIEASATSRSCLRVYAGMYGYWANRCIEYGYDVQVGILYHGSDIWEQGEAFFDMRMSVAKKGMPGVLPTFPVLTPLAVRELHYSPRQLDPGPGCVNAASELSANIISDIVETYSNDAARVMELTGKTLKRLEVIGKPLTGLLPPAARHPPGLSSMARL